VRLPESLVFQVRHEELVQFVFVLRSFWLFNDLLSSNLHFAAIIYTHAYRYDACASRHTFSSLFDILLCVSGGFGFVSSLNMCFVFLVIILG